MFVVIERQAARISTCVRKAPEVWPEAIGMAATAVKFALFRTDQQAGHIMRQRRTLRAVAADPLRLALSVERGWSADREVLVGEFVHAR